MYIVHSHIRTHTYTYTHTFERIQETVYNAHHLFDKVEHFILYAVYEKKTEPSRYLPIKYNMKRQHEQNQISVLFVISQSNWQKFVPFSVQFLGLLAIHLYWDFLGLSS